MKGKVIQVLGTSSNVGKTTVATVLCRALSDLGYKVAPFKSVNMSLNSVAIEGSVEISRSVWLQCKAARTEPIKEMNPFLLKPEGGGRSQMIYLGTSIGAMDHKDYGAFMGKHGENAVRSSLQFLADSYDVVVAEGAGSAAELNFRGKDLANSFVSSIFSTPSIIVGDIDRGGVFASIYGTHELMENPVSARWFVINRMRGDPALLESGISWLEKKICASCLGVIPYLERIGLPGEDSLDYRGHSSLRGRILVMDYPYMENQSDLDPLLLNRIGFTYESETDVNMLEFADAIILPGSKNVASDLDYIRERKIDSFLKKAASEGKKIIGICGGYQMLGKTISMGGRTIAGLDLLDCDTEYGESKTVMKVSGRLNPDVFGESRKMEGYEIHYGNVTRKSGKPMMETDLGSEGTISDNGNVMGTNFHGILESWDFLKQVLGLKQSGSSYETLLEKNIADLTERVCGCLHIEKIRKYVEIKK